jgi:hypothetical protein
LSIGIEASFTPETSGTFDFGVSVQGTADLYLDGTLIVDNTENQKNADEFLPNCTIEEVGSMEIKLVDRTRYSAGGTLPKCRQYWERKTRPLSQETFASESAID